MTSIKRSGATNELSAFDPAGLGRPPSAARVIAEQSEQRILGILHERLDRLLPPGIDLGKIRPPDCRRAIDDLAGFTRRLDRLAARIWAPPQDHGSGAVLGALWQAWNAFEACRSLEDVHGQLKLLDENFTETVRRVHQVFEKPDPDDSAGVKIVPPARQADFQLLLDIVTQLFAIRRAALIAELNDIEGALCDHWFAAGAEGWAALDDRWREWAND